MVASSFQHRGFLSPAPVDPAKVAMLDFMDFNASLEAAYSASQVMGRFVVPRACSLPANLAGSVAKAGVAATGSRIFAVAVNGAAPAATITFAAGGITLSTQAAIALAAGDVVTITAPASTDATLAQVAVCLVALPV